MAEELNLDTMAAVDGGKNLYNYQSNGWVPYTIKSGDTLGALAASHGTTVKAIMEVNPRITNANMIYAGDKVLLPPVNTTRVPIRK